MRCFATTGDAEHYRRLLSQSRAECGYAVVVALARD